MSRKKNEHALWIFLIGILLALPFAAWNGFAISTLWGWFVQPLGLIHIGVWEAAGLSLLVHLLVMDTTLARDSEKAAMERFGESCTFALLMPAFFLAFGALYHAL